MFKRKAYGNLSKCLDLSVKIGVVNNGPKDTNFDAWIQLLKLEHVDPIETPAETCSRSWIQMHLDFSCSIGSKSLRALQLEQVVQSTRMFWAIPCVQSVTHSIGSRSQGTNKRR